MNCDLIHRRLLALERPNRPPPDVRQHLAACSACRAWHEHLVQIEADVPRLPVPPAVRKEEFFPRLLKESPPVHLSVFSPPRLVQRERGMKKMAVAVALAATLLIVAMGVWIANQNRPGPSNRTPVVDQGKNKRDTRLAKRLERDPRWQEALTDGKQVEFLDTLAHDAAYRAMALAKESSLATLDDELGLYVEAIDRLSYEAQFIADKDERKLRLLPIAQRLALVTSEAKRLAEMHPKAGNRLERLAKVALVGEQRLRQLTA